MIDKMDTESAYKKMAFALIKTEKDWKIIENSFSDKHKEIIITNVAKDYFITAKNWKTTFEILKKFVGGIIFNQYF